MPLGQLHDQGISFNLCLKEMVRRSMQLVLLPFKSVPSCYENFAEITCQQFRKRDVGAICLCPSLLRTQIHKLRQSHVMHQVRALGNKINKLAQIYWRSITIVVL